jgi:hypothetical protein
LAKTDQGGCCALISLVILYIINIFIYSGMWTGNQNVDVIFFTEHG